MVAGDSLFSLQIGDGAGHPQAAVIAAARQVEFVNRAVEQALPLGIKPCDMGQLCAISMGIDGRCAAFCPSKRGKAVVLACAGRMDAGGHGS